MNFYYEGGTMTPLYNDPMLIVATAVVWALSVVLLAETIYIFQIKEYRFDRTLSQLREDGFFGLYRKYLFKRPAISVRNILIFALSVAAYFIAFISAFIAAVARGDLVFREPNILIFVCGLLVLAILTPMLVPVITSIAIAVTAPLASYKRKRLIRHAVEKVRQSNAVFIGISGTYGKSTTKEYLYHILSRKFKVGKTDENMNTDVGVAISILKNLKPDTQYFVAEVGAYKSGEVRRAAGVFSPKAAIMLPFGNQHMDLFGSHENMVAAESEILEFVPKEGTVYVNADIPELQYVLDHSRGAVITYSITKKADIFADDIESNGEGSGARIHYNGKSFKISTKLLGRHVIQNLLPVIATAIDAGMKRDDVSAAIATLPFVPGKLSVHEKNGAVILNDTGNSSLHGFLAAIDTIKLLGRPNIFILSKGIIELGKEKKESYKKIIMQINEDNIGLAATDKLFKQFDTRNTVTIVQNENELYDHIVSNLNGETAVLLEGKFTKNFLDKFV